MATEHVINHTYTGVSSFSDIKGLTRDRPWLLPSNRKLRHLQGLSLRNLTLSKPSTRPRGKTIDDDSLPYSLKTQAKILALRETPKLEHSRSSSDLKTPWTEYETPQYDGSDSDAIIKRRPSAAKIRRRSTLNWTNAPPRIRQQKLEDVTAERMADTWFSLHCTGVPEPIYVSEVVEKAMNPNFRLFDLNTYGPLVTRQDEVTIKYFARTEKMNDYMLLIELRVNLRSLQFIGKSLESFYHPFPHNSVLFHLSDGIYTSFTDLPLEDPIPASEPKKKQQALQPTATFDALMRLSNLDDCIQDALTTRERLTLQISKLLQEQKMAIDTMNSSSQAEERLASAKQSLTSCQKQLRAAQSRRSDLQASLAARRAAMISGQLAQQKARTHLASAQASLAHQNSFLQTTRSAVSGQIRRICEDLLCIYPIESIDPKSLSYTIHGLHLPNAGSSTAATNTDPAITAAALGLVAHVTHLLSFYLSTAIPYPPSPHGSTSTILDPISTTMPSLAARTFPLYQKGAVNYRFEYGVFLLNSDIELLMSRQGSRMVDLRHTLPNLKYLLTVLTAGKGELPVRKQGGVKALENGHTAEIRRVTAGVEAAGKGLRLNGKEAIHDTRRIVDDERI